MSFLKDGFSTKVVFSLVPLAKVRAKRVTPPGLDGGGPIATDTMHNTATRTKSPKALITMTSLVFSAKYDPAAYDDMLLMINVNQLIEVDFPDGSILQFWGYVDKFMPGEHVEGDMPLATITIEPTNEDDNDEEALPIYTAP